MTDDKDFFVCVPIDVIQIASKLLSEEELGRLLLKACGMPAELSYTGEVLYGNIREFQKKQHEKKEKQLRGLKQYQKKHETKSEAKGSLCESVPDYFEYKKTRYGKS